MKILDDPELWAAWEGAFDNPMCLYLDREPTAGDLMIIKQLIIFRLRVVAQAQLDADKEAQG